MDREIRISIPGEIIAGVKTAAAQARANGEYVFGAARGELLAAVNDSGIIADQSGAALNELARELAVEGVGKETARETVADAAREGRFVGFVRAVEMVRAGAIPLTDQNAVERLAGEFAAGYSDDLADDDCGGDCDCLGRGESDRTRREIAAENAGEAETADTRRINRQCP